MMKLFTRNSRQVTNLEFANSCRDFYKITTSVDMNASQVHEAASLSVALLGDLMYRVEDPVALAQMVVISLNSTLSDLKQVEHSSLH